MYCEPKESYSRSPFPTSGEPCQLCVYPFFREGRINPFGGYRGSNLSIGDETSQDSGGLLLMPTCRYFSKKNTLGQEKTNYKHV